MSGTPGPRDVATQIRRTTQRTRSLLPRTDRHSRRGGSDGQAFPPDESDEGAAIGTAYAAARASTCTHSLVAPDPNFCSRCAEARGDIARVQRSYARTYVPPAPSARAASGPRDKRDDDTDPLETVNDGEDGLE